MNAEDAWGLAAGNLPVRMGELSMEGGADLPGLVLVSSGNGLATSHLAQPGFCANESPRGAVYLVVGRGAYLRADRSSRRAVDELINVVRSAGRYSATPLECRDNRLVQAALLQGR